MFAACRAGRRLLSNVRFQSPTLLYCPGLLAKPWWDEGAADDLGRRRQPSTEPADVHAECCGDGRDTAQLAEAQVEGRSLEVIAIGQCVRSGGRSLDDRSVRSGAWECRGCSLGLRRRRVRA